MNASKALLISLCLLGVIFTLVACAGKINTTAYKMAALEPFNFASQKKQAQTNEVHLNGEYYDPIIDEDISKRTLKAWRVALSHNDVTSASNNYRKQDEQEAMRQLIALSKQYPQSSYVKTMMGQVQQHFGKQQEAAKYYEAALATNLHNPNYLFKLAEAKRKQGLFEDAKLYYQEVLKIQPGFNEAQLGLACCLVADKRQSKKKLTIVN